MKNSCAELFPHHNPPTREERWEPSAGDGAKYQNVISTERSVLSGSGAFVSALLSLVPTLISLTVCLPNTRGRPGAAACDHGKGSGCFSDCVNGLTYLLTLRQFDVKSFEVINTK